MSEQTPDTNNDVSNGQDPSMEDILASIRKIIAEDDTPVVAVGEAIGVAEIEPLKGDVSELVQADYLDLDIIEDDVSVSKDIAGLAPISDSTSDVTDIDALIGDMDEFGTDDMSALPTETLSEIPTEKMVSAEMDSDDILDLMIPMEDAEVAVEELAALDVEGEDLALEIETVDLLAEPEVIAATIAEKAEVTETISPEPLEDDLSLMLDNMLEDTLPDGDIEIPEVDDVFDQEIFAEENLVGDFEIEDLVTDELIPEDNVVDSADDLLAEIDFTIEDELTAEATQTDPDIDLVKSLMADLTEEPLHDNPVEELDDFSVIDIDDADGTTNDVMDEILSITLDDETKLSEELEVFESSELAIPDPIIEDVPLEALSLKEIAAQAAEDAEGSGLGLMAGATALAGLGAAGVAASSEGQETTESAEDDIEGALADLDNLLTPEPYTDTDLMPEEPVHITPESITEETTPMARAKKSDAIIDEVTEEATAGAFASLTNVVETKAVKAERGDRIGDLVTEALQPMLKEWLDKNLKGIVERAVTKEVKRISSGK